MKAKDDKSRDLLHEELFNEDDQDWANGKNVRKVGDIER